MHRGLKSSPDVSTIENIFHPYRMDDLDVVLDFLRLAKGGRDGGYRGLERHTAGDEEVMGRRW